MQIICHRRNAIEELIETPVEYGVEIDIRSYGKRVIVCHDPFMDSVDLEEWGRHYHHAMLILNIKEEGLEYKVKEIVEGLGIKRYLFLDLSFPSLIKMVHAKEKRVAVRFSEYESLETAMRFAGKAEWVWVDCFTKMPLTRNSYLRLSQYFKICLVSPELQGRDISEIQEVKRLLKNFRIDAVCTKHPNLWTE